jgi:GNAT superfamily N-acetyltransferase
LARQDQSKSFPMEHSPLVPGLARFGSIAKVPWDTEIFGFAVGDYRLPPEGHPTSLGRKLLNWACVNRVELISTVVPAMDRARIAMLEDCDFAYVDSSLSAMIAPLSPSADNDGDAVRVREAEPDDWPQVENIAATAFSAGRYHADVRFPRVLADRRYRWWMERALRSQDGRDHVYVTGETGRPVAFLHVVRRADIADMRLVAIDPRFHGARLGRRFYAAVLNLLPSLGVHCVHTKFSALNAPALNLYASLGFRFSDPEVVLHWHAPDSPYLLSVVPSLASDV